MAVGYWILGVLALDLALPPGYSSPVWPGAGVALVAALEFGVAGLVGTALGSLAVNSPGGAPFTLGPKVGVALGIALGAALQAGLGAWLIRRLVGFPVGLLQLRQVSAFLLLGGPLACLCSAGVGSTLLVDAGLVPPEAWASQAVTWWVGDSVGVFLGAPMLLAFLGRPREVWRPRIRSLAVPVALILSLTWSVFQVARAGERRWIQANFDAQGQVLAAGVERAIRAPMDAVRALRGLYEASPEVSEAQFRTFARAILEAHPELQALEWAPRVRDEDRPAFEAQLGAPILERLGPRMWRADERPAYAPVRYVEPQQGNETAIGFDLASEVTRLRSLERAVRRNDVVVTGRIELVQGGQPSWGVLMVAPVFRAGPGAARALQGWVLGVVRTGAILEHGVAGGPTEQRWLRLVDLGAAGTPTLTQTRRPPDVLTDEGWMEARRFDLACGDRTWGLWVTPTLRLFEARRSLQTWGTLLGALLLSALVALLLLLESGRAVNLERVVLERTTALVEQGRRLARANEDLDQFASRASHDLKEPLRNVASFAALLETRYREVLDERGRRYLDFVLQGANRMSGLVDGLLAFARSSSTSIRREATDLGPVMDAVRQDLAQALSEAGGTLEVEPLPEVACDPELVRSLLQNLVSNALKYVEGEPPRVRVRAREVEGEVLFLVEDNGIGVPLERRDAIFEPFLRLHQRRRFEGTGIGLATCARVVEAHGGRIWVEDREGGGSIFAFTLEPSGGPDPTSFEP